MNDWAQSTLTPGEGPFMTAVLTFLGALVLGFFSMGLKRWFCHKAHKFMKRHKRLIDELGNVILGVLLFCGVTFLNFTIQADMFRDTGRELLVKKDALWLWLRLGLLTVTSLSLFVAAVFFRTPLARVDIKRSHEKRGKRVPEYAECVFPRTRKAVFLILLTCGLFVQCWMVAVLLMKNVTMLRSIS